MEEKPEPFKRHGKSAKERIEVRADDVLNAIAEGRDIDVECADIQRDLDIRRIDDRLERDDDDRCIIMGNVSIVDGTIGGNADFTEASFSGDTGSTGVVIERPADFTGVEFRGNAMPAGFWNRIQQPTLRRIVWLVTIGKSKKPWKKIVKDFLGLNLGVLVLVTCHHFRLPTPRPHCGRIRE